MTAEPRLAVFRADATAALGAGHAMRCLSLAGTLAAAGWTSVLASGRGTNDALPRHLPPGVAVAELDGGAAAEPGRLATLWPDGCDLFVLDHYAREAEYEKACRPWARRILVMDDLANRPHDCDVLLDPAVCRTEADYAGLVPEHSLLLLGPAYLPLRDGFAACRRGALARRASAEQPRRLLLSFGATDPGNASGAVLDILTRAQQLLTVDILLGDGAPHLEAVRRKAEAAPYPARLHVGIEDVADLLAAADIAIGAGGGGAWERCCLGLPSIVSLTAGNQRAAAESLHAAGAAIVLGDADTIQAGILIDVLQQLIADVPARRTMERAAACLCDGLGARRLTAALDPPLARDGAAIRLRPAVASDAARMLAWQRDPRTRRHFRNPLAPETDQHHVWLSARLGDPDCLLNIIMHGTVPAGVLRLDARAENDAYEIAIHVAPDSWRLGIGGAALALARALLPEAEFWAEVLPANDASHALFAAADYRASGAWYVNRPGAIETSSSPLQKAAL